MKTKFTGTIEFEVEYPKKYKLDVRETKNIEQTIKEFLRFDSEFSFWNETWDSRKPSKVKVKIKNHD